MFCDLTGRPNVSLEGSRLVEFRNPGDNSTEVPVKRLETSYRFEGVQGGCLDDDIV